MTNTPRYAELRDYLRVVRQQRFVVLGVALAFAAAALAFSVRQSPTYIATTSLATQDVTQGLSLLGEQASPVSTPERIAAVTAETITRPAVINGVRRTLKTKVSDAALRRAVSARVEVATLLVAVQASWGDAAFAAKLANAFARQAETVARREQRTQLQPTVRSLERQIRRAQAAVRRRQAGAEIRLSIAIQRASQLQTIIASAKPVEVEKTADAPSTPTSPRPVRNTVLALVVGLVIGLVLAFLRDALDRRLRTTEDVEEVLGLEIVGRVNRTALGRAGLASPGEVNLDPIDVEAFNILRTNVEFMAVDTPPRTVLVTSGLPEEGKSSVAASVAAAAAASGRQVLLLECDLRRPALAGRMHLRPQPGLTDYLAGTAEPGEILQTVAVRALSSGSNGSGPSALDDPNLVIITAGSPHPRPAELLASERCSALLRDLREAYDLVVVDTSPVLAVADTLELVSRIDAVLLCVRAGQTTRDQARAAREALARLPDRPTAVVLTGLRPGDEEGYGYYSYSYAASHGSAVPAER